MHIQILINNLLAHYITARTFNVYGVNSKDLEKLAKFINSVSKHFK